MAKSTKNGRKVNGKAKKIKVFAVKMSIAITNLKPAVDNVTFTAQDTTASGNCYMAAVVDDFTDPNNQKKQCSCAIQKTTNPGDALNFTIIGLLPDTSYVLHVFATDTNNPPSGVTGHSSKAFATPAKSTG